MFNKFYNLSCIVAIIITGFISQASAEPICYDVGGSVTTENATPTLQIGSINLTLDNEGQEVFSETGSLVGNITGADGLGGFFLSHVARFPQGNSFNTTGDKAVWKLQDLDPTSFVRLFGEDNNLLLDAEGNPCSFYIHETISNISRGTKFFKDITSAEVFADGYISNCPSENENYFDLSGEICGE